MQRSMNILPFPHVIILLRICTSVCPGAGHLSSFFLPGVGHCTLKEKESANARGWAMLELTDALLQPITTWLSTMRSMTNIHERILQF